MGRRRFLAEEPHELRPPGEDEVAAVDRTDGLQVRQRGRRALVPGAEPLGQGQQGQAGFPEATLP